MDKKTYNAPRTEVIETEVRQTLLESSIPFGTGDATTTNEDGVDFYDSL